MENTSKYKLDALPDMNQRGGFSLYCDDVRPEVSGKTTIVGAYGPVMYVTDFPALLPTFFIVTTVWTNHLRPFEKLIFRVILDDTVLSEQVVDVQEMQTKLFETSGKKLGDDDVGSRQLMQRVARFSPFILEKECVLRVRIQTEDGELRTSGLAIRKAVPPTSMGKPAPDDGTKNVSN